MSSKPLRLLYFVSHPIQYQVPLLRYLAKCDAIDFQVIFRDDISAGAYVDEGFGCEVKWDTPLLDGYSYQCLSVVSDRRQGRFSQVATLLKLLFSQPYDVLWLHGYAKPSHFLAMIVAKLKGVKVLVRGESVSQFSHGSLLKGLVRPFFFKLLNCFVDGYLVIGTENRRFYQRKNISDRKLFFSPYTVDNEFFKKAAERYRVKKEDLRLSLGWATGRPIILYASKMQERKQAGDLLEAYIRLVSEKTLDSMPCLLFVGDGEMRPVLEARAAEMQLESVRFLGFKNQSELPAYFDLCDVFVLPSVRENWGLIINEVMNAGRAVIVSDDVGCATDLVEPGVNGMIYPARDVDALTDSLLRVLSDSNQLRKMGEKSLERISHWGIARSASGILEACYQVSGRINEK